TSSRRSPGVRRRSPGGMPTSAGFTRARLVRRNAASSGLRRCAVVPIVTSPVVTSSSLRPRLAPCQVLPVPASPASPPPYRPVATLGRMTTTSRPGPGPAPAPTPSPAKSEAPGTDNRPRLLLAVVLAALFMAVLDVFIVNVAAPTIGSELHASGADLQLV